MSEDEVYGSRTAMPLSAPQLKGQAGGESARPRRITYRSISLMITYATGVISMGSTQRVKGKYARPHTQASDVT